MRQTIDSGKNKALQSTSSDLATAMLSAQLVTANALGGIIQQLVEHFFGVNTAVQFFAATPVSAYFWELQDFYAAQFQLSKDPDSIAQLRFSQPFCHWFIEKTLGKPAAGASGFDFSSLTGFEVHFLEEMSQMVFDQIQSQFTLVEQLDSLPAEEIMQALSESKQTHYYFIVTPSQSNSVALPVVITLPRHCNAKASLPQSVKVETLSWPNLALSQLNTISARFALGKTRVKLSELKQLNRGDVVLLENSRLTQCHWWDARNQNWGTMPIALSSSAPLRRYKAVDASVESSHRETISAVASHHYHSQVSDKSELKGIMNYWENLEVDVLASFEPQKFPIKRLQEISEGLVVEVGSLVNNRIMLSVDGQVVAYGELVVIGTQFGVRVKGLYPPGTKLVPGASDLAPYDKDELKDGQDHLEQHYADDESSQAISTEEDEEDDNDLLDDLNLTESDFDGDDNGNWQ